jgi:hypothetical protein
MLLYTWGDVSWATMNPVVALLAPAFLGRCQTTGQRQANLPQITIFEDGNPTNRTRGVETPEAMPSTGPLYVHQFDKPHDLSTICYSGSPIGTFYERNCCDSGTDCNFIEVDRPVFGSFRDFTNFVAKETNLSGKVFTAAVECNDATRDVTSSLGPRMVRTAAERSGPNPEAAPYEFVARQDESACDCRSALPEFHSDNYPIGGSRAHAWASTLRDIPGGPNLLPALDALGACNFFESGYGWNDDEVAGVMVPLIPKRPLAPQQRFRVNASGYRIPLFDNRAVPTLPCDGNPNLVGAFPTPARPPSRPLPCPVARALTPPFPLPFARGRQLLFSRQRDAGAPGDPAGRCTEAVNLLQLGDARSGADQGEPVLHEPRGRGHQQQYVHTESDQSRCSDGRGVPERQARAAKRRRPVPLQAGFQQGGRGRVLQDIAQPPRGAAAARPLCRSAGAAAQL